MSLFGPLPQLLGAAAMIGLAVATAIGLRPPAAAPPQPEISPADEMRTALAAFAHWLPRQPAGVRLAVAEPAARLLERGTELVEALAAAAAARADGLLSLAAVVAARQAIVRDLPETVAMLDALPAEGRLEPRALTHFSHALGSIADAALAAADAVKAAVATQLEIQQTYLEAKFPRTGD